jgi:peptide-methionine (R)-S-oxide reductase
LAGLLVAGLWVYGTRFATPPTPHQRPPGTTSPGNRRVEKTDAEWRKILTGSQFDISRRRGTEWAGSSPLTNEHRVGVYACVGCRNPLFRSATKFESDTADSGSWPSFYAPIVANAIYTEADGGRTEVRCAVCDAHLGHVFSDGPAPTGLRYCMNGTVLTFHE